MRSLPPLSVLVLGATLCLSSSSSGGLGTETSGAMTLADAQALAQEIVPKVEALRGARFTRPVAVKLVDDATARTHFRARIEKFWPPAKITNDQYVYAQLGLIPRGTDLMKVFLDLMEEQAGAYYDPDLDTFFVLTDMPRRTAPLFVSHELTHALDDQRFQIDALLDKVKDDDDRGTALSAVAEGSATVVMTLFMAQEMQAGRLSYEALAELQKSESGRAVRLSAAPPVIQRSLLGPYVLGQAFLLRGNPRQLTSLQPADIDRVFKDPPTSTEQIIHPEKYWEPEKRDLPKTVALPDLAPALGPSWFRAVSGTVGEMVLAILTGVGDVDLAATADVLTTERWTNAAATGWGGDTYHHYVSGPRRLTVLATVWDTPLDAIEFEKALASRPSLNVSRRADVVIVLAGDAGASPQAVAEAAFQALATGRVPPGTAVR
jgi:hypothetical protein